MLTPSKIGELNGKWSILFRTLMTLFGMSLPFIIMFAIWITVTLYDIRESLAVINYKQEDRKEAMAELKRSVEDLKTRLIDIEKKIDL